MVSPNPSRNELNAGSLCSGSACQSLGWWETPCVVREMIMKRKTSLEETGDYNKGRDLLFFHFEEIPEEIMASTFEVGEEVGDEGKEPWLPKEDV